MRGAAQLRAAVTPTSTGVQHLDEEGGCAVGVVLVVQVVLAAVGQLPQLGQQRHQTLVFTLQKVDFI